MAEGDKGGVKARPGRNRGEEQGRTAAAFAALIGALGAVVAALLGGFFLLVQPLATRIIDEYWMRTSEIRIADVRAVLANDKPTIDVVLWNATSVAQVVISVEVGLAQEGPPLALIGTSTYQLNDELVIGRAPGRIKGSVRAQPELVYPFDGVLEVPARGGWSLRLTIPVRETLAPGETRSLLFVLPSKIRLTAMGPDWTTGWLPFSSAGHLADEYLEGPTRQSFLIAKFLSGQGSSGARIRAKRGDGKMATYDGSIRF